MSTDQEQKLLNVNVGVLGHVDSGKTSLVAALSTTLSTAALDKHPQSKERGITLDLGFSSFTVPASSSLAAHYTHVQFTLVDCPGHASLLHTIIGGAQIIDAMMLIVDVTKGIQPQTAECIVIGEMTTPHLVVVLNKIDLLPDEKREKYIKKAQKMIHSTLKDTRFANCPIVPLSARHMAISNDGGGSSAEELVNALLNIASCTAAIGGSTADSTTNTTKELQQPFIFYIDHCFSIKGQGTILTGTVIQGQASIGDDLHLPELRETRKIKSMQVFKRPVSHCKSRDRVGICVTNIDPSLIERGLACISHSDTTSIDTVIPTFSAAIAAVKRVRYYPGEVKSHTKIHIIIGHHTVMARLLFFSSSSSADDDEQFNGTSSEYEYEPQLPMMTDTKENSKVYYALLRFDRPVTAASNALLVGARLDAELGTASCRICFSGSLLKTFTKTETLDTLRIYTIKQREVAIERVESDGCTVICRGMFDQDAQVVRNVGVEAIGPRGEVGLIQGSFGKSGKFKVYFPQGLVQPGSSNSRITLNFKQYTRV